MRVNKLRNSLNDAEDTESNPRFLDFESPCKPLPTVKIHRWIATIGIKYHGTPVDCKSLYLKVKVVNLKTEVLKSSGAFFGFWMMGTFLET